MNELNKKLVNRLREGEELEEKQKGVENCNLAID